MGWDATRPVPWKRFAREWLVYAVVFALAIVIIRRDDLRPGQFVWLALSLPIWVGFSALLAKFGYVRKTLKDIRAEATARAEQQQASRAIGTPVGSRPRPAPTKRTSTGPSSRPKGRRR